MNISLFYNKKGNETIAFAAAELEHYLSAANQNLTFSHNKEQVDAPLVISLGITEDSVSQEDDFYQISFNKEEGFIKGSNARSVLLGVYALLHELGFRFLLPDKTYIPENLSLDTVNLSFSHKASLRHRGVCIEGADSLENVLDFIDWLPKVGFNSFFLQFKEPYVFLQRWYEHVFNPTVAFDSPTADFYQECYQKMAAAMKKRSLLYHAAGHGWTCEAIGQPSIGWVKSDNKPSSEIQKLLALVNGKREYIDGVPMNTNLCYSNPEAIDRFCNTVITYIEEHPTVDYLHIWLADETNHICECETCQKENFTDQYVHILNEIDARLTKKKLDCKLIFLLYQELLYPPVQAKLNNPERFTLMFAPISRSFNDSYPDQIHEVPLPEFKRNNMTLPVNIDENLTYLKKWQDKVTEVDSLDYDYPLGRAHYGDFGYTSISRILCGDIKNLQKLGLNGYISCQELRAFLPNGLPNYSMGALLLDLSKDFDDIFEEYYKAAYGSNYKRVMDYLLQVSELSNCDYFNNKCPRVLPEVSEQYKKLLLVFEKFLPVITETLAGKNNCSSSNDKLQLFFWQLLAHHAEYGIRLTKALIALSGGNTQAAAAVYQEFCSYIRSKEPEFQPYLDVYRIIEVSTKYTGFKLPELE